VTLNTIRVTQGVCGGLPGIVESLPQTKGTSPRLIGVVLYALTTRDKPRSCRIDSILPVMNLRQFVGAIGLGTAVGVTAFQGTASPTTSRQHLSNLFSASVNIQEPTIALDSLRNDRINQRLQFLWERYVDEINLLITLITGVIAVSVGLIHLESKDHVVGRGLFMSGMIFLVASLVGAMILRPLAQQFMEVEVFGNAADVSAYFSSQHIEPFTQSYLRGSPSGLERRLAWVLIVAVPSAVCVGLTLLSWFAYSNLPSKGLTGRIRNGA
jgi:hypothetical protein